jgi:undecaprenyl-diphosphatase
LDIKSAIVLGAVQGLTEFLPVSSSGHLVLLQKVFGIQEPALLFDTMLHMGTLLAVFVVLRRDILAILRHIIQPLTGYLILATIPAVVAALVFEDHIEAAFQSGRFLGFSFLLTSALLVIAELLSKRNLTTEGTEKEPRSNTEEKKMTIIDALVIGVLQAVAIIPGVSRSGATISGALSRGLDRDFAARFSFLLSIPAILGALVFQLKDLLATDAEAIADGEAAKIGVAIAAGDAAAIAAGTVFAAVVGFFAIRLMLKIVRERSLFGFAVYTAVLGALVLVDQFATHLVF